MPATNPNLLRRLAARLARLQDRYDMAGRRLDGQAMNELSAEMRDLRVDIAALRLDIAGGAS